MDEKFVEYRARKIANQFGIPYEDAIAKARREFESDSKAAKLEKYKRLRENSKKSFKKMKARNKKTVYLANANNVVGQVVSGGLPTLGKRN